MSSQTKKEKIITALFHKPGSAQRSTTHRLIVVSMVTAVITGLITGIIGILVIMSGTLEKVPALRLLSLSALLPEQRVIIRQQQSVTVTERQHLQDLVERSKASVVTIVKAKVNTSGTDGVYRQDDIRGFGFVLSSDGWIMTTSSVLTRQTEKDSVVVTHSGSVYTIDTVVVDDLTNTVFIKIPAEHMIAASLANEHLVRPGEQLFGLSVSFPSGQSVASELVVVQLGETSVTQHTDHLDRLILTSQALLFSQPVFNRAGEVVGLQSTKNTIRPIYHSAAFIEEVLISSSITRPSFGASWIDLRGSSGLSDRIRNKLKKGAYIKAVDAQSPAELAGIRAGDVVQKVQEVEVNGGLNFSEMIQRYLPGDTIILTVLRNGEELEFEVELGELKQK